MELNPVLPDFELSPLDQSSKDDSLGQNGVFAWNE